MTSYAVIYTIAGLAGLVVGSFLNVVISRLPVIADRAHHDNSNHETNSREQFNLWVPRSRCESCKQAIAWYDLVPILSWLLLRGQCRNCQAEIPWRYPLVETFTCLFAILIVGTSGGFNYWSLVLGLFMTLLLCQAVIDYEKHILLDSLSYMLLWLGLVSSIVFASAQVLPRTEEAIFGALFGYLSFWLINFGFRACFKKDGMGAGDFKLFAAIGAWVGWVFLPFVVLIAIAFAFVYAISQVITKKYSAEQGIPFGPFLAGAGFVAVIFREKLTLFMLTVELL